MSNSTQSARRIDVTSERSEASHTESSSEPSTTSDVARKAHSLVDKAADKAADIEQSVREGAGDAQDKLHEKREAAADTFNESVANVEDFVKRRPLAAAGIAFAAGILTSRLVKS